MDPSIPPGDSVPGASEKPIPSGGNGSAESGNSPVSPGDGGSNEPGNNPVPPGDSGSGELVESTPSQEDDAQKPMALEGGDTVEMEELPIQRDSPEQCEM